MGSSNASRNGRGGTASGARHAKHAFDEGEEGLFALSLDDVMSDRPWTAEKLMAAGFAQQVQSTHLPPRPRRHLCPRTTLPPVPSCRRRVKPPPHPVLLAIRPRRRRFSLQRHSAPRQTARFATLPRSGRHTRLPSPSSSRPSWIWMIFPTASLPLIPGRRQIWTRPRAAMPALDIPVNPLFAAAEEHDSAHDNTAAYANRPRKQPRASRIETEDYGQTSSDYSRDPFAATPAPDYNQASVKAASASSYTHGTDDRRAADYHTEEEPPRFSEFSQAAKVVFIAIIIALLGVIAFEGFQLFRGPTASESATQQKEDDNQHLDINTLKGDPNDGDE